MRMRIMVEGSVLGCRRAVEVEVNMINSEGAVDVPTVKR
jgi:hypothetical protein